ncbi:MAG: bifunctional phosphoribosylaminoimidazolecarboxamide formyltransferase/IMP cyclohydrolase [Gemmatimonadetes bacterium]|nr:bifunctional phosphoribosylaminoimidazolecarboxamide formyltransferase/IMP cyclohydrolase [Gemmatimonadota bacterium]
MNTGEDTRMPIALVSVSDKNGIERFCEGLVELGWSIVSTGGTRAALIEAGLEVTSVSELTGHPEMLAGRVKTLHPTVHAGILARRSVPNDLEQLEQHGIGPIDLVAVNLYPFQRTVARESVTLADALEQIDIGGPTLLRAAAKNHDAVWSVCDPDDYDRVLRAVRESEADGEGTGELRRELAAKVFRHTSTYDAAIAGYLAAPDPIGRPDDGEPEHVLASMSRVQTLRYGENPDQEAAFFRDASRARWGIPALTQIHGKELSFNNLLDVDGALVAIAPFAGAESSACAIVKHTTPCGLAIGRSARDAYQKALACDPTSAFGSVIAFTEPVSEAVADALAEHFVECVVAPGYADAALVTLQKKKNLRILQPERPEVLGETGHLWPGIEARGVRGGVLLQTAPAPAGPLDRTADVPTRRAPTDEEWDDLSFAWSATQSVKSNAILLARDGATIGIGAGQMSRVDSVELAIRKAATQELDTTGTVLGSDAFFPFRDGIDVAAAAGVRAIVQPGGSMRDEEVVAAADEHDIAMVFTKRRLFRH